MPVTPTGFAARYASMASDELLRVAADFSSLLAPAQQALQAELRKRGLDTPEGRVPYQEPHPASQPPERVAARLRAAAVQFSLWAFYLAVFVLAMMVLNDPRFLGRLGIPRGAKFGVLLILFLAFLFARALVGKTLRR